MKSKWRNCFYVVQLRLTIIRNFLSNDRWILYIFRLDLIRISFKFVFLLVANIGFKGTISAKYGENFDIEIFPDNFAYNCLFSYDSIRVQYLLIRKNWLYGPPLFVWLGWQKEKSIKVIMCIGELRVLFTDKAIIWVLPMYLGLLVVLQNIPWWI